MKRIRSFRRWSKQQSNAAWDRLVRVDGIRRVLSVALGLALSAYPMYAVWVLGVERDFSPEAWGVLIAVGIVHVAVLASFGAALRTIGRWPGWVIVGLLPVVGAPILIRWCWVMSEEYVPLANRTAFKQQILEGLDDIDHEVYRLRFDPDEELFLSRRRTAHRLNVSEDRVRLAEGRLESRFEQRAKP